MRRFIATLCLAMMVVLCPILAKADGVYFKNRATLSTEFDDNVYKATSDIESDFLARLFLDLRLDFFASPNNQILLNYQGGVKKYFEIEDQDTLINLIRLGYINTSLEKTFLGVESSLKIRNIRSAEEDYNKFITEGFAGHEFGQGILGQIRGGYTRFDFRSYNYYDYWHQRYGVILQKNFELPLTFGVQYFFQNKHFPFNAYKNVGTEEGEAFLREADERRRDNLHEFALFTQYSKWLLVDFMYLLQMNESNSYGDSYYNHRFTLGLSKAIFKNTHLHLLGIAQFRDSYEDVLIPHSYSIEEDDENYNSITAKVNHKFTKYLSVEGKYSRHWTSYSSRDLNFIKNLYSIGLAVSF